MAKVSPALLDPAWMALLYVRSDGTMELEAGRQVNFEPTCSSTNKRFIFGLFTAHFFLVHVSWDLRPYTLLGPD